MAGVLFSALFLLFLWAVWGKVSAFIKTNNLKRQKALDKVDKIGAKRKPKAKAKTKPKKKAKK